MGLSINLFESKMLDVGNNPGANIHGPALILLLDQQAVPQRTRGGRKLNSPEKGSESTLRNGYWLWQEH